jgi:hypothetical protein
LWSPAYRNQRCAYSFERNLVIAAAGGASAPGLFQGPNGWCNASFANNLYYNHSRSSDITDITDMSATFPGKHTSTFPGYPHVHLNFQEVNAPFSEWRAKGQDERSLLDVDPMFMSADPITDGDFRVHPDSPAVAKLNFVPFDLREAVGPRRRRS